eukprot:gene6516-13162_t
MASSELAAKLARRNQLNEVAAVPSETAPPHPATLFKKEASSRELAAKLERRNQINEGVLVADHISTERDQFIYKDFPEFSIKHITELRGRFNETAVDGHVNFNDLKKMLEKLGEPQTHFTLRNLMKELNVHTENEVTFREFLLILRRQQSGNMDALIERMKLESVDVAEVGVSGAKSFFEAKQLEQKMGSKAELEMRLQQEAAKKIRDDMMVRKKSFKERIASFDNKHDIWSRILNVSNAKANFR